MYFKIFKNRQSNNLKVFSIFLIFAQALFFQAVADCTTSAIWALPSKSEIQKNNIIILELYGHSSSLGLALENDYKAFFVSETDSVRMEIKDVCQGMFYMKQVILKPIKNLKSGVSYSLQVYNTKGEPQLRLKVWNSEIGKFEPQTWNVNEIEYPILVCWKQKPELFESKVDHYGCGPAVSSFFSFEVKGEEGSMIHTQLQEIGTEIVNEYILNVPKGDLLDVGHGMCSGPFYYKVSKMYRVRFMLLDASGSGAEQWTDWIEFASPLHKLTF